MKPKPWSKRWERPQFNVQGIRFELYLTEEHIEAAKKAAKPWEEFDMIREYDTTKIEQKIWEEVNRELKSKPTSPKREDVKTADTN